MTKRPSNIHRFTNSIVRMREPLCPDLRALLYKYAREEYPRVFPRGVYVNTEPPRFETAAEIRMLRAAGADITGHTLVAEAYLARAIGACYASAYIISNYAEGVEDTSWIGSSIFDYYRDCAEKIGRITVRTIAAISPEDKKCTCMENLIEVPGEVKKRIAIDE
ncbi:MAG: MTAP family purine nucleoside phosphorylase [Clostridiales bacterium]|nr:MTAP family purine nucleoside phosphorylase [Clostridiales bacterium]